MRYKADKSDKNVNFSEKYGKAIAGIDLNRDSRCKTLPKEGLPLIYLFKYGTQMSRLPLCVASDGAIGYPCCYYCGGVDDVLNAIRYVPLSEAEYGVTFT